MRGSKTLTSEHNMHKTGTKQMAVCCHTIITWSAKQMIAHFLAIGSSLKSCNCDVRSSNGKRYPKNGSHRPIMVGCFLVYQQYRWCHPHPHGSCFLCPKLTVSQVDLTATGSDCGSLPKRIAASIGRGRKRGRSKRLGENFQKFSAGICHCKTFPNLYTWSIFN